MSTGSDSDRADLVAEALLANIPAPAAEARSFIALDDGRVALTDDGAIAFANDSAVAFAAFAALLTQILDPACTVAPVITPILAGILTIITTVIPEVATVITGVLTLVAAVLTIVASVLTAVLTLVATVITIIAPVLTAVLTLVATVITIIASVLTAVLTLIATVIAGRRLSRLGCRRNRLRPWLLTGLSGGRHGSVACRWLCRLRRGRRLFFSGLLSWLSGR